MTVNVQTDTSYCLHAVRENISPPDATTYHFGRTPNASSSSSGVVRIYCPKAGVIKVVYVYILVAGTLASAETSTMSIRLNGTTDTTISSSVTLTATSQVFSNTGLSISIAQGDYIELKWVTPTWATNPTGVYVDASIMVEPA